MPPKNPPRPRGRPRKDKANGVSGGNSNNGSGKSAKPVKSAAALKSATLKSANTHSATNPKGLPGIKHVPLRHNFSSDESDDSMQPLRSSQPQSLLGLHNTLKQLLSAGSGAKTEAIKTPTRRKNGPKPPISSDSPINSASTPISRLKRATAQLNSPDNWAPSPAHFDGEYRAKRSRTRTGRENGTRESATERSKSASAKTARGKPPKSAGNVSLVDLTGDDSDFPSNKRRSSYNNRGKRQLSVGNGYSSKPHSQVSAQEYYKLLDPSIPEPNQMRQLLTWCFKKSMERPEPEVSSGDETARGIAKIIKEELLSELSNGSISTSWYSLKDTPPELAGKRVIKPNPLNEANKESLEVFRRKLRLLELEKLQWREALESNLRKIHGLSGIERDENVEALRKYLLSRDGGETLLSNVLGPDTLVDKMEQAAKSSEETLKNLPSKMDQLYHILYQLKQSLGLVDQVEKELLTAQVSKLVKTFMDRNKREKWSNVSTRNLMRGIAKLDLSKRKDY